MEVLKDKNIIEIAQNVINTKISALHEIKNVLNENFLEVIHLLLGTKGKVISTGIGKSGVIARKFAATLSSTGTAAIFMHTVDALHGDLGMISKNDLVILLSNSGNSIELIQVLDFCQRSNINTIGITRNANSQLASNATKSIVLPATPEAAHIPAPTTSTTQMLALCDTIAVILSQKKGFGNEHFKEFHPGGSLGIALLQVREIMNTDVPLVKVGTTLNNAVIEITSKRLGCVGIVNEKDILVGIITDGDLRRHIEVNYKTTKVEEIMTTTPLTFGRDEYVADVMQILNEKRITNAFILENNKPIGVVHLHDFLKIYRTNN